MDLGDRYDQRRETTFDDEQLNYSNSGSHKGMITFFGATFGPQAHLRLPHGPSETLRTGIYYI